MKQEIIVMGLLTLIGFGVLGMMSCQQIEAGKVHTKWSETHGH